MYKYVMGWDNKGSSRVVLWSLFQVPVSKKSDKIGWEGKIICLNVKELMQRERLAL
jgi:hypothetical protein